jgi:hypothetical protein
MTIWTSDDYVSTLYNVHIYYAIQLEISRWKNIDRCEFVRSYIDVPVRRIVNHLKEIWPDVIWSEEASVTNS